MPNVYLGVLLWACAVALPNASCSKFSDCGVDMTFRQATKHTTEPGLRTIRREWVLPSVFARKIKVDKCRNATPSLASGLSMKA